MEITSKTYLFLYDRPGALIPLVNGGTIKRNADAMCIYTDNVGYVSCKPMDPSVIRRMGIIIDSYELPKVDVISRVKYNTGFSDDSLLNKMYDTWKAIDDYCRKNEISEGTVSATELEMWAACVQVSLALSNGLDDELYKNCVRCVVSKATSNIEEQNDIKTAVLDIRIK